MKTLLVGINAKFIHSNLAIRYIQKYAAGKGVRFETAEYTINQSLDLILDGIMDAGPDLVGFSCYLWNIEMVRKLIVLIKQVKPNVRIFLGGPEVSYDTVDMMDALPQIDYMIAGEGEVSTTAFVRALTLGKELEGIAGLTYRKGHEIIKNPPTLPMDLAEVPFVYEEGFEDLDHKIIYYETSRGCPYACQYCLSSIEKGVRFRPIDMVKKELQVFLDAGVTQVKFVDRTFNARPSHTWAIWEYLHEHDNGVTNFHFEITADLMDDRTIDFLAGVRPGLFQFEVGVQSTHEATILAIERKVDFDILKEKVRKVMKGGNIHMHLDLIAGLPEEDYETFGKSFNDVMAIGPEQLQLGFLKVLKGSRIHQLQKSYGIVYRQFAPYEVLSTKDMSYEDLRRLKAIEELLETYYNSGQFAGAMGYIMKLHSSPFECFEKMAGFWGDRGWFLLPHNKIRLYELLYEYALFAGGEEKYLEEMLRHDIAVREKPKKWPAFMHREDKVPQAVRDFYNLVDLEDTLFEAYKGMNAKQKNRMTHLEYYENADVWWPVGRSQEAESLLDGSDIEHGETLESKGRWLLYDYMKRNIMTGQAEVTDVSVYIGERSGK